MAEKRIVAPERFIGGSGDSKSTDGATSVRPGATWLEYDTGDMYITYDGANWVLKGDVSKGRLETVTGSSSMGGLAGTYAANDVVSDGSPGTAYAFAAVARANETSGYITNAKISVGTSGITPRLTLFLFNAVPTDGTTEDNVANLNVGSGDQGKSQKKIDFPALENLGSGYSEAIATPSTYGNLPISFDCASGADDLYGVLVTRDAVVAGTAIETRVDLTIEQF